MGLEQPEVVEGDPTHGRRQHWMGFKILFSPNYPRILDSLIPEASVCLALIHQVFWVVHLGEKELPSVMV